MEKLNEWKDWVWYRTNSDCGERECAMDLSIENFTHDEDKVGSVSLTIESPLHYPFWNETWYNFLWKRLKVALTIMFTGRFEVYGDFIFRGPEHIREVITTLDEELKKRGY